jgi:hypothetical protein
MSNLTPHFEPNSAEPLAHALARAREELARRSLPPDLQARMLAAAMPPRPLDALRLADPSQPVGPWRSKLHVQWLSARRRLGQTSRAALLGSAMSSALAVVAVWWLAPLAEPNPARFGAAAARAEFMAVPGMQAVSYGKEQLWLVQTELPSAQLVRYGLPFDPAAPAQLVPTQLLLNAQGQAVALRIVSE